MVQRALVVFKGAQNEQLGAKGKGADTACPLLDVSFNLEVEANTQVSNGLHRCGWF